MDCTTHINWQHGHCRMKVLIIRSDTERSFSFSLHLTCPQGPTLELWTAAILSYTSSDRCCSGCKADRIAVTSASFLTLVWLACGSHIAAIMRPGLLGEPPFGNMVEVEIFLLKIMFPSQYLPSQCDVKICQVHMICLEDERSVILREPHSVEDAIAFFLPD